MTATLGLAMFGVVGHLTNGGYFRPSETISAANIDQRLSVNQGLSSECDGAFTLSPRCRTSDDPEVVLWGDSYAMHLTEGLKASRPDIKMIQFTRSICGPIIDMAPVSGKTPESWARECMATNDSVLRWLRQQKSVRFAVLSSPFGQYVGASKVLLKDGRVVQAQGLAADYLRKTIDQLETLGMHVVVFSPPPSSSGDIGRCLKNAYRFAEPYERCNFPANVSQTNQAAVLSLLRDIAAQHRVVWLADGICATFSARSVT